MPAPYPISPPSAEPCTWGEPIAPDGFSLLSNLKVRSSFMASSFPFHFCWVSSERTSYQPQPALQSSRRTIRNLGVTGTTRPIGSHTWTTRATQPLFAKSSFTLTTESFLRQKVSSCLSQRWPSKSVKRSSPLVWSTSGLFEWQALTWNWPFASILPMVLVICLTSSVNGLDPPVSSTYFCFSRSFEASGNSTCEAFAKTLIAFVAISGAGLSLKFNLSHWYSMGGSCWFFLHRNLWKTWSSGYISYGCVQSMHIHPSAMLSEH